MKRIEVKGPIISNDDKWIYEWLDMESTAPKDVVGQLPEDGSDVEVIINSGGGDVYAGSEIYTELKSYGGQVTVKVVGVAASAASVIAMAGDRVVMSPTAHMMIHNVSSIEYGDRRDMEKKAEVLESHDKSIANAYMLKTGKSQEELLALMGDETWMDSDKAVENGFADEVMFKEETPQLVASVQMPVLPKNAMEKLKAFHRESVDANVGVEKIEEIVSRAVEKAVGKTNTKTEETKQEPENKYSRFFF